jgi:hypothetical protein
MAVHDSNAATIPSTEFRFTNTDGLRVACAHWHTRAPCAAWSRLGMVRVNISGSTSARCGRQAAGTTMAGSRHTPWYCSRALRPGRVESCLLDDECASPK